MMRPLWPFGFATVLLAAAALCPPAVGAAQSSPSRRIGLEARGTYFILDTDFFGLAGGFGAEAALRYELASDIYFENSLGVFGTEASGVTVSGFDYGLTLVALFPVLLPYRPVARAGVGFITVDPVTVTPTNTFRPAQTTFYLVGGAGISRSIIDRVRVEANASFWITPYRYRVYAFDRYEVRIDEERFAHIAVSLGAVYSF